MKVQDQIAVGRRRGVFVGFHQKRAFAQERLSRQTLHLRDVPRIFHQQQDVSVQIYGSTVLSFAIQILGQV